MDPTELKKWNDWFEQNVPAEVRKAMLLQKSAREVTLVRENIADLMVTNPPMYSDINLLFPLYEKLAFQENVLLKGPKGNGKTLSITAFAAMGNCPLVTVECSENTKDTTLIGNFFLSGRDTGFVLGKLPTAIDVANECGQCILVFEEFNALTPQVQKTVNALLDFRRFVTIPQIGKTYRLKDGARLWVVATMNPSVYGGTYDLNEDLKSRLEEIEIGYPTAVSEKQLIRALGFTKLPDKLLDGIINFAKETRQSSTNYALSPRDTVRLARNMERFGVVAGSNPQTITDGLHVALQLVACKFEGEDRDVIIKRIESSFVGVKLKKSWGAPV